MQTNPMTKAGEQKIRSQIQFLKDSERPRITAMIAEARAHGDLKERVHVAEKVVTNWTCRALAFDSVVNVHGGSKASYEWGEHPEPDGKILEHGEEHENVRTAAWRH